MINNVSITPYRTDHREACAELFLKVYSLPPFEFEWLDHNKALSYFTDLENNTHALNYVLTDDAAVIGVCMGQKEENFQNPSYKINEFFIAPEYQHNGLGSFFLGELNSMLRELGLKAIYLFTQRRMPSYDFYRKNSFIPNEETVHMARMIRQEPTVLYARTFIGAEDHQN